MKIIIAGIGRVGLVTACCLADAGHHITGIEIDPDRLNLLNKGVSPFHEEGIDVLLKKGLSEGNIRFLASWPAKIDAEIVIIAVNTPTLDDGSSDLSRIYEIIENVKQSDSEQAILVMKSTVPPGTGKKLCKGLLRNSDLKYVSNPEFLRTGQGVYDWYNQSRIVIGATDLGAADKVQLLYANIKAPMVITDITSAEMIKCASNAFLAAKVSFINETADICDSVGANIDAVAHGMGLDHRIGPAFLQAGIGYGGSCLPKDIRALSHLAGEINCEARMLEATIKINEQRVPVIIKKLKQAMHELKGKKITLLGLAFKPGTDDVTDSPALRIAQALIKEQVTLTVYDPTAMANARLYLDEKVLCSKDLYLAADQANALIIATEWTDILRADWQKIRGNMHNPFLLVDGRNALNPDIIEKAGLKYIGIGR